MNDVAYGATDQGRRRQGNEDSYRLLPEKCLYIVADGMGGHNAGEVASLNAVKIIDEYFTPAVLSAIKENPAQIEKEMIKAINEAYQGIVEMSRANKEYAGMGSTIVLSFFHQHILHTCHVGDSRAYVINQAGIRQITNDHSTVAELVQMGQMTKEEARHSTLKNQITQALGSSFPIEPEYNQHTLDKGDRILLCTDGLWDMLSDEGIQAIVREGVTLENTCRKLINAANEAGGDDNVTVVLVAGYKGF